ncbi:PilW family protein [Ralstonia pseudosolanacearum]|uniref:Tfp pilus assembly protein PilW n=1 Tax=Ralstonia solanacearum TaxID=305 RepID=A0A0S4TXL9_RALSL|nr:hypothetical protein [Ralstonia pseudosolanacearum]QCX51931.1 hypothetical protein E7Z57_23400 [Ralstonia pseudosolanacearum]CUV14513.1 conserved protein of unknown function [Ralstonia solanacearum]
MAFHFRTRQQGISLISLMVGQIISLLAILAMLGLFRAVSRNVFDKDTGMQPRAIQDRQVASALLTAQNMLQGAGFGIASPTVNTHFVLVNGVVLSGAGGTSTLQTTGTTLQTVGLTSSTGNAIFWESNPTQSSSNAAWSCQGLVSNQTTGALYWLQAASGCDPLPTNWAAQQWTVTRLVGDIALPAPVTFAATAVHNSPCWPYGSEMPSTTLSTQIGAEKGISNASQNTAGLQIQMNWATKTGPGSWLSCLPNFTT